MDLIKAYGEVEKRMERVDFPRLWPGFQRTDFILYNGGQAVLNGEYIPKSPDFFANTAILFKGKQTAIWNLTEDTDIDVLTSKMAHEMFHAFQQLQGEKRFPDENGALFSYRYHPEEMTLKHREDLLLCALTESFRAEDLREFCILRKTRESLFPYEFSYQCGVEAIEGPAQYVELAVLAELNQEKGEKALKKLKDRVSDKNKLFPVRILCYDTGALLLTALLNNGLPLDQSIGKSDKPYGAALWEKESPLPAAEASGEMTALYEEDQRELRARFAAVKRQGKVIREGEFGFLGANIYSARYQAPYLWSEYFVQLLDGGKTVTLEGSAAYLLETDGESVRKVYSL